MPGPQTRGRSERVLTCGRPSRQARGLRGRAALAADVDVVGGGRRASRDCGARLAGAVLARGRRRAAGHAARVPAAHAAGAGADAAE